jgi:endonuclease/exonuclease/phosphatase (EEP) superfamily protein YafD
MQKMEEEKSTKTSLRVLTYNVNFGCCYNVDFATGAGLEPAFNVAAALLSCEADVCSLTETTPEWNEFLTRNEEIAETYPFQLYNNTPNWMAGGQHILSKYPIESVAWEPALSEWFPGWIFKVDENNPLQSPLYMLGVHLRPPLSTSPYAPFGLDPVTYFWTSDKDHQRDIDHWSKILWDQVKEVEDKLQSEVPVFVLGDFNEEESGSAYKYLENESNLRDARKEFDGARETWTWPVLNGTFNLKARYDHLFYRPSAIQCISASVVHSGCSDHYPVVAEFIKKPPVTESVIQPQSKSRSIGSHSFHS